jgi:hypothetical protein
MENVQKPSNSEMAGISTPTMLYYDEVTLMMTLELRQ